MLLEFTLHRLRQIPFKGKFFLVLSILVFAFSYLLTISIPLIFARLLDDLESFTSSEIFLLVVVTYPLIYILSRLVSEVAELIYLKFEDTFEVELFKAVAPRLFNAKLEVLERRDPSQISFRFYHGTEGYIGLLLLYLYSKL